MELDGYLGSNRVCKIRVPTYVRPWDEIHHVDYDKFGVTPVKKKFYNTLYPSELIAGCYHTGRFTQSPCLVKER